MCVNTLNFIRANSYFLVAQYVFDSSPGKGLIVFEKGEDLMPAVKVKLGIQ